MQAIISAPTPTYIHIDETASTLEHWIRHQLKPCPSVYEPISDKNDMAIYGDNYHENLLRDFQSRQSDHRKVSLCLTTECCDSYMELFNLQVRHIIYPDSPFAGDAIRLAVQCINITPPPSATSPELSATTRGNEINDSETLNLLTSDDCADALHSAHTFFLQRGISDSTAANISLSLKEAITNSVFHAFRESGSHHRKYTPDTFTRLEPADTIQVGLHAAEDWCAVKVTDNRGSIGPLSIANSLDRHRSERGILDSRGRGFHLMRHLAHRVVIIVQRGVFTSIELYFLKTAPGLIKRHLEIVEI